MSQRPRIIAAIPVLPVLDLAKATEFYRDRLGFRTLFSSDGYAGVIRDTVELHLWVTTDPALARVTSCRLVVEGVDALYRELREKDVIHPKGALAAQPWGTKEFVALDLDGNALRFAEELTPGMA